jgi:chaperonin GroEL
VSKKIITRDELMAPKLKGLNQIAGIVKRTLGPGGLPILIQRVGQSLDGTPLGPKITKDGVSVADECSSPIEEEDIVIQAIKGICKKTVTAAGDGTTTAIVLGEALVLAIEEELKADKSLNPQLVKESVEEATAEVLKQLKKIATKVKDNKMIEQVATISANGDKSIGEIIAQAFDHVGAEGVVTVDEGKTNKTELEMVNGYQFNRGVEGRNGFFNDQNQTKFETKDGEKAAIVIYDGRLNSYTQLMNMFNILQGLKEGPHGQMVATKKIPPLVIMANEFSSEVLQFLLVQKQDAGLQVAPITGPHVTHVRSGYYDDLAVYTGANRLGNGSRNLESIEEDDIGIIGRVVSDKYKTTFYDGDGVEEEIIKRVDQLKAGRADAESPYDASVFNDRIAALTSGVAKIGVGGSTEFEIKEKYDRIEDALNAARAAIQEGVVPGGGATLLRISHKMKAEKSIGHKILKKALQAPFNQILENVEYTMSESDKKSILTNKRKTFDARNKKVKNALTAGIIDPVKVTRSALENAVSIAGLLATAGGAIIYKKD